MFISHPVFISIAVSRFNFLIIGQLYMVEGDYKQPAVTMEKMTMVSCARNMMERHMKNEHGNNGQLYQKALQPNKELTITFRYPWQPTQYNESTKKILIGKDILLTGKKNTMMAL